MRWNAKEQTVCLPLSFSDPFPLILPGILYEFVLEEQDEVGSPPFFMHIGLSVGLVLIAGLMSGLTMGLMSLDLL